MISKIITSGFDTLPWGKKMEKVKSGELLGLGFRRHWSKPFIIKIPQHGTAIVSSPSDRPHWAPPFHPADEDKNQEAIAEGDQYLRTQGSASYPLVIEPAMESRKRGKSI